MSSSEAQALDEEIHALRTRIIELERQLSEARSENGGGAAGVEQTIEDFFNQSSLMFVVADLVEGRFLRVNQKVCEVLGLTENEVIESSFLDRVHPADRLETMHVMERLVAGDQTAGFRNRHLAADGKYRTFEWTATVDPGRELCYAVAMDVTGQGRSAK